MSLVAVFRHRLLIPLYLSALFVCPAQNVPAPKPLTSLERLKPEHLEAVHQTRVKWMMERRQLPALGVYQDFRAVIHVHAEDAEHTLGTREQVLEGAKNAGVQVIMWTDHPGAKPGAWHGMRDGILFIPGSEDDHLLRFPNPAGDLTFLSHVEERPTMPSNGSQGMEIYNRHADATAHPEVYDYIKAAMAKPREWKKLVSLLKEYPDEVFAAGTDIMPVLLQRWDEETAKKRFTGIAANDAHRNQVFKGVTFDPYEVAFRHTSTHILARQLTEGDIRASLREGHVYVAHDWLCDPTGFRFVAINNLGVFDIGDRVPLFGNTRLEANLPVAARIKIIHEGKTVAETSAADFRLPVKEEGPYRLEAWLRVDGEDRPWIYSNPIYAYQPGPDLMRLPSPEIAANVEVIKSVSYTEGKPEDADKHKLDLYLPKDKKHFPVLVFLHGGAWRSGDRANYPALGNRFAKAGIGVAIPSYRLAPANTYQEQMDDVAAAFAWVHTYIARYGGDPQRLYLVGHSAGGHLAALLALDPKYLQRHGLAPNSIRGVAALSGVYDVRGLAIFGNNPDSKKDASPIFHVHPDAPPFVVTYCQWDYPSLPAQARDFDSALREAFDSSRLVYVPGENHISEIIDATRDDDPTANAVLGLINGK